MTTLIHLNHAKTSSSASGWSVLFLLLACVFIGAVCWNYFNTQREISALTLELQHLTQPKKNLRTSKVSSSNNGKDDGQAKAVHRALAEINTPWHDVFKALESANQESIKLLSFEPSATTQQVRLSATALSVDDMMAYVNRLATQSTLRQVRIISHEATNINGVSAIVFHVEAQWPVK